MTQPVMIAIDWGTSNFRAYLVAQDGAIVDRLSAAKGIMSVDNNCFDIELQRLLQYWLQRYATLPLLMAGMVGSSSGWANVPYQLCPIDPAGLSANLYALPDLGQHKLFIVPGVRLGETQARADVMRGEETQLVGILLQQAIDCCCLPGTHSKWVSLEQREIKRFTTYMTGELYALLTQHSILHKQIAESCFNQAEFVRGVRQAENDQGLLANCFNVRAQFLMGSLLQQNTESYLSGLLLGYEVLAAKPYWQLNKKVAVVASQTVLQRYQLALEYFSIEVIAIDGEQAVVQGLMALAKCANLIGEN